MKPKIDIKDTKYNLPELPVQNFNFCTKLVIEIMTFTLCSLQYAVCNIC